MKKTIGGAVGGITLDNFVCAMLNLRHLIGNKNNLNAKHLLKG